MSERCVFCDLPIDARAGDGTISLRLRRIRSVIGGFAHETCWKDQTYKGDVVMPTIRATPEEIKEIEDRLAAGLPPFPDSVAPEPVTPPKVTEGDFLKQVLTLARACGWRTAHFRPAMTKGGKWITAVAGDGKGFPDLVLLRDDEFIIAELKVPPNTVTPEQKQWLDAFSRTAACEETLLWVCTWTPADWPTIEAFLARKI